MTPAVASPAPVAPAWTTPQILKTGLAGVWAAGALLMVAGIVGARSHRHAIQIVGRDSAPSIIAAQHIRAALADMDAEAANEMLSASGADESRKAFEQRRTEAVSAVVAAAENITYGEAERGPIRELALGIGTYSAGIQTARDKNSIPAWREAAQFMDTKLLPAAEALDQANRKALDQAYDEQHGASIRVSAFLTIAALLAGCALIGMQVFLASRMKRVLNPGLLAASLVAFTFVVYAGQRFQNSDHDLKVAKEDAFESIHTLWRARALAYAANGDESRYLLDPAQAVAHEKDFRAKANQIAHWPESATDADSIQSGLLADELKNITFEGEKDAAVETVKRYFEYLTLDRQIRALETKGQHAAAVALCTGNAAGQSNAVFAQFDAALDRTLEVNQRAFNAAVERAFAEVSAFEVTAPLAALLISALAWLGLRPRMREYGE